MKIMRYLFYMILILSNIEVQGGSYSIDSFLNYLQENGYYDLIQAVKIYFGDDIAIDVCKGLVETNDCEIIVRIYMTEDEDKDEDVDVDEDIEEDEGEGEGGGKPHHLKPYINIKNITAILEYFEKKKIIKGKIRELIELILSFYNTLLNKMENDQDIINFIKKIIKQVKKAKYLEKRDDLEKREDLEKKKQLRKNRS